MDGAGGVYVGMKRKEEGRRNNLGKGKYKRN